MLNVAVMLSPFRNPVTVPVRVGFAAHVRDWFAAVNDQFAYAWNLVGNFIGEHTLQTRAVNRGGGEKMNVPQQQAREGSVGHAANRDGVV